MENVDEVSDDHIEPSGKDRVCLGVLSLYKQGNKGAWIDLPAPADEIERFLVEDVGVGDKAHEVRIFDTDFKGPLSMVGYYAGEFDSIEDLNLLAHACEYRIKEELEAVRLYTSSYDAQSPLEYANALLQVEEIPYFRYDDPDFALSEEGRKDPRIRNGEYGYLDMGGLCINLKGISAEELREEYDVEPTAFSAEAIETAQSERDGYVITAADGYRRVMSASRYDNLRKAVSATKSAKMCTNRTVLSETGWLAAQGRAMRAREAKTITARDKHTRSPKKDAERARKAARTKKRPKSISRHV